MEELGGPWTHNHYPAGWAQAGNTPFKYYKHYTYAGGIRTPLIIKPATSVSFTPGVRDQFHHVIDIAPTILDVAGVASPSTLRGVKQQQIHGTSMRYTFGKPQATGTRRQQYFETAGHRGIWRDGWKALTSHISGTPYENDKWELYQVDDDRAETRDVSAHHPGLVKELAEAWWLDAERFDVLPLDDRRRERAAGIDPTARQRSHFRFLPGTRALNRTLGPDFAARSFSITAYVHRSARQDEGVLLAHGRRAAGFAMFVQDNRLWFDYNLAGHHTTVCSDDEIPTRDSVLAVELERTGEGAVVTLLINGAATGHTILARTLPGGFGCLSTQAGHNAPSPVSPRYSSPFRFSGTLRAIDVHLSPDQADTSEDEWRSAMSQD
jgi:arylsulfatase